MVMMFFVTVDVCVAVCLHLSFFFFFKHRALVIQEVLHSLSVTPTLYMSFTPSINLLCGLPPAWSPYIPPYLSSHCLLTCLLRPPPLPLFLPNSSAFSIGNLLTCQQHWRLPVLTQALTHLIWKSHS